MRSTIEPLEGNKVKVSIEVDADEFESEVDAAFRRLAKEVRLPGFRPGKAPRRLLESRLGTGPARADALQHAIPGYYEEAVLAHSVDIIASPEIDITAGTDEGDVAFDAVVEVRPQINLGGYENLRVTIDAPEATVEEIEERIDRLREQEATFVTVERAASDGDSVTINIAGTQDGEEVPGATADDYSYEVGSGTVAPEMDDELRGAKSADILTFSAEAQPGQSPIDFRILVKEVKEKVLPAADDEWASENTDFDTYDELRADTASRLGISKKLQAEMALQQGAAEALADLVTEEVPDALVAAEMQQRVQDLGLRLQAQGIEFEQYFSATGQDPQAFEADLRETATGGAKVDLALRALSEAEGIDATDEDLDAEYNTLAERTGQSTEEVREQFDRSDRASLVRSDIKKRKALEWLLGRVEIVDRDGNQVDRDALAIEADEAEAAGVVAAEDQPEDAEAEAPPTGPDAAADPPEPEAAEESP